MWIATDANHIQCVQMLIDAKADFNIVVDHKTSTYIATEKAQINVGCNHFEINLL